MTGPNSRVSIRKATLHDIPVIRHIAMQTWPETYGSILSPDQLEYMLELIYSPAALAMQFRQDHHFHLAEANGTAVGFCSYFFTEPGVMKLAKLYVIPPAQGTGAGKALMNLFLDAAKKSGATKVILNVNRFNNTRTFYEKLGFTISHEEKIDIGNGYIMDDYVMMKFVEA